MSVPGQLTKDKFGYSVPVDAPLYEPFPLYYEDTRILMFPYLTDAAKAAALVPPPLEVVTVDPQGTLALAEIVFAKYPFSNVGAYNEVEQSVAVTYKGAPGAYAVRLHVTNDMALTAGREIGGFPKKLGAITFDEGGVITSTLEAPAGLRICTAELAPLQPVPWLTMMPVTYYFAPGDPESVGSDQAVARRTDPEHVGARSGHVLVRAGSGAAHGRVGPPSVPQAADPDAPAAARSQRTSGGAHHARPLLLPRPDARRTGDRRRNLLTR